VVRGRALRVHETTRARCGDRYDRDGRRHTPARRPPPPPATSGGAHGEVSKHNFDAAQPKGTLRYSKTTTCLFYGGWSRGFARAASTRTSRRGEALRPSASMIGSTRDRRDLKWAPKASSRRRLSANAAPLLPPTPQRVLLLFDATKSTQNLGNSRRPVKGPSSSWTTSDELVDVRRLSAPRTARHANADPTFRQQAAAD